MNKLNIVNPLNPNQVIKTIELTDTNNEFEEIPKIEENKIEKNDIEENDKVVVKKKKKLLLPIILIILILTGLLIFLLTKNNDNEDIAEPKINTELQTILKKLEDDDEFLKYTSFNKIENNKLLITVTVEDVIFNYEYTLEDNKLTTSVNSDDELEMLLLVIDAIAQKNSVIEGETYNYLKNVDFKTTNIEGIEIKDKTYTIDITKTFNSITSYNYFSTDELNIYKDFLVNTGNVNLEKNNLVFYKLDDNNYIKIIIGQKNELDELTFNTILSVVEVTFENELENFKTNYTTLETKTYNRYSITIDPVFDTNINNLIKNYKDTYKFIQLNIKKS